VNEFENLVEPWWNWRLLGRWIAVNATAYVVIVVGGVALEQLASGTTKDLADDHRVLAVLVIALLGGGFQGLVQGRWQWRILRRRVPALPRRLWVIATLVPALIVWLLSIAPGAVDTLAMGGDSLSAFKNGFMQALVLGPLIGLSQMTALRDVTTRWRWWFAANITTWLFGAATFELGKWLVRELSLPKDTSLAFPLAAFCIHGIWMLWVTAPVATVDVPPAPAKRTRRKHADTGSSARSAPASPSGTE
jgi:hypothetical protein